VKALLSISLLFVTTAAAQMSGGLPPVQSAVPPSTAAPPELRTAPNPVVQPKPDESLRALQGALNQQGYNAGNSDGFMGPQTQAAILAAERASGLPVTGLPSAALVTLLRFEKQSIESTGVSFLEDRETLGTGERIEKYRKQIGRTMAKVRATLSGELSSPVFDFPQLANKIEHTQVWWQAAGDLDISMVFHNSTSKSLDGLVLKIIAGRCDSGEKTHFRFITFASEVKADRVVATAFPWFEEQTPAWRCIDIVDVIFK
jgi:hypothetical protein